MSFMLSTRSRLCRRHMKPRNNAHHIIVRRKRQHAIELHLDNSFRALPSVITDATSSHKRPKSSDSGAIRRNWFASTVEVRVKRNRLTPSVPAPTAKANRRIRRRPVDRLSSADSLSIFRSPSETTEYACRLSCCRNLPAPGVVQGLLTALDGYNNTAHDPHLDRSFHEPLLRCAQTSICTPINAEW